MYKRLHFINIDLFLTKRKVFNGSNLKYYYIWNNRKRPIHIADGHIKPSSSAPRRFRFEMFPVNQEQSAKYMFIFLFSRQQEGKCRSLTYFTLNRNMSPMCINNIFCNCKSKSRTSSASCSGFIRLIKAFKNEW